jgi:hypothetical protein
MQPGLSTSHHHKREFFSCFKSNEELEIEEDDDNFDRYVFDDDHVFY